MRALLPALLACAACRITAPFECMDDAQCTDGATTGVCEANHACAFADTACESGLRFDDLASDETVAGECVPRVKPPGCEAWHPHFFDPCAIPAPVGDFILPPGQYLYNTDSDTLTGGADIPHASIVIPQVDGPRVRVLSVGKFTVSPGVRLQVTGSLPLIVAAWKEIAQNGVLDASSAHSGVIGPGANDASCMAMAGADGANMVGGAGGGGGGGFQGAGGDGGKGNAEDPTMATAGGKGGKGTATAPKVLRGGCAGARSGTGGDAAIPPASSATFSPGGSSGGAIHFASPVSITNGGYIIAGGSGGAGALIGSGCGGGGGGSGGYLGLEAPMVTSYPMTLLLASAGAGGAGAEPVTTGNGTGPAGADMSTSVSTRAAGGVSQCGGTGGDGNVPTMMLPGGAGHDGNNTCGGGGGAGGAGFIVIYATMATTTMAGIDPPATMNPM